MKPGKLLMGLSLILWGILLLLITVDVLPWNLWEQWPVAMIFAGLCMHFAVMDDRAVWGLVIPGAILVCVGVLFFICSNFGWRYLGDWWPVFILGVGLGLIEGWFFGGRNAGLIISGSVVSVIGLAYLLQNLLYWRNIVLPLCFITGGVLVLALGNRKGRQTQ